MPGMGYIHDVSHHLHRWAKEKRLLTSAGKPLPMLITEFGYQRHGQYGIPEPTRAKWYVESLEV
jgi:hypothetical protein